MKEYYIHIYNKFIKLARNKELYKNLKDQDVFSDRLTFFLIHFAIFFKVFKNKENKIILQEIYDFTFRQLELSIREIGYGDQSINKKMKDYINLFHDIIDKFHFWDDLSKEEKEKIIIKYTLNSKNSLFLLDYFENFLASLKENTLNSYIKSVIKT
jgi:cytochrome b pre-mRNA-processing protein 3